MRALAWAWMVLGCASTAWAASEAPLDVQELSARSDRVVVARVSSVEVTKSGPLWTTITLAVEENLQGSGKPELQLLQLGGKRGELEQRVAGAPRFVAGERAIVFLRCQPSRCALASNLAKLELRGERVIAPSGLRHHLGELLRDWRGAFRRGQRRAPSGPARVIVPQSPRRER